MDIINDKRFNELIIEFYKEEQEDTFKRISGDSFYSGPYLYHKYLEQDSRLENEIFPYINDKFNNGNIKDIITNIYKKNKVEEINQYDIYISKIPNEYNINIKHSPEWIKRERCKMDLLNLDKHSIEEIFENERISNYAFDFIQHSNETFLNCNFFNYQCFELLYKSLIEQIQSLYSDNVDNIKQWYLDNYIELKKVDEQFSKYGLLTLKDNMEFMVINRPRVFDNQINRTMFIKNVNFTMAKILKNLIEKKYIEKISFRIDNNLSMKNRYDKESLLEGVQFGKGFSFENLGEISISKLYSEYLQDTLWILIDEYNITFEEIVNDFDITDNETIVTQVIHLEYYTDNGEYYISHIDHEYIFYTIEEFEIRQNKYNQKGTASKRLKSFKIDSSHIPFYTEDQEFILYKILDEYFMNKDLLKEYFENVLSS